MTMGAYLTAARLRRHVSIDRAAEDTRIKRDFLMRMESDEFDFLSPAYVRGFLRTYAQYLHIDPDPILDEFDRRHAHTVDASQIVALQRRARKVPREPNRPKNWVMAVIGGVFILGMLAAIGLLTNPDEKTDASEPSPTPRVTEPVIVPQTTEPSTTSESSPTVSDVVAAGGVELIVDAVNDDCWVDITIDGVTIFSDTLAQGTVETFTSDQEMTVVLGLPKAVELTVNGEAVGSPGGHDPIKFTLPDDLESLRN